MDIRQCPRDTTPMCMDILNYSLCVTSETRSSNALSERANVSDLLSFVFSFPSEILFQGRLPLTGSMADCVIVYVEA